MITGFIYHTYDLLAKLALLCIRYFSPNSTINKWYRQRQSPIIYDHSFKENNLNLLFICASLGEYESVKILSQNLRNHCNIHLSFFSSSGYDIIKSNEGAWHSISYTPTDTSAAVKEYLNELKPDKIVISHNFLWPSLLREISSREIPLFFLEFNIQSKTYLKRIWFGLWKPLLTKASLITTSDKSSYSYLNTLVGGSNLTLTQTLRLASISKYSNTPWRDERIEKFIDHKRVIAIGSAHMSDLQLFHKIWSRLSQDYKLLIIPHELDQPILEQTQGLFINSLLLSDSKALQLQDKNVLIIDQKGMLKYLYRYADLTYIGGGFDRGIHNALEASIYNLPVLFGPNYQKFSYARNMISLGIARSIDGSDSLLTAIESYFLSNSKPTFSYDEHELNNQIDQIVTVIRS